MEAVLLDVRRERRLLIQKEGRHKSVSKKRGISEDLQDLSIEELEQSSMEVADRTLQQNPVDTGQCVSKNTRYAALKEKQKGMKGRLEQFKKEKENKKQAEIKKSKDKFVVKHVRTPKAAYLVSGRSRIKKDIPLDETVQPDVPTEKLPAKQRNKQMGKQALPGRLLRSQAMLGEAKKASNAPVPSYKEWKRKQAELKKQNVQDQTVNVAESKIKVTRQSKVQTKNDPSIKSKKQTSKNSTTIASKKEAARNSEELQNTDSQNVEPQNDFVFSDGLDFLNFNFGPNKAKNSQMHYFASSKKSSTASSLADNEQIMDTSMGESQPASPCKLKLDFEDDEDTMQRTDSVKDEGNTDINIATNDEMSMEVIPSNQNDASPESCTTQFNQNDGELFPFNEIRTASAISKDAQKIFSNVRTPIAAKKNIISEANPRTPVNLVKDMSVAPRLSLTPKNFLSKLEDPIAAKIDVPTSEEKKPDTDSSGLPATPEDIAVTVKHFTGLVDGETHKFEEYIREWEIVMEEKSAPEEVHGNILAGIGQAQLLIRKRFKQFRELIKLHKDTAAEKAAHASDLDGFWEMVYIQVEDIHKRFADLQKLKDCNWKDENIPPVKAQSVKKTKPSLAKKKPPTAQSKNSKKGNQKSSALRKFLAEKKAAAQKLSCTESADQIDIIIKTPKTSSQIIQENPASNGSLQPSNCVKMMDSTVSTTPLKEILQQEHNETPMAPDFSQYLTCHIPAETPLSEKPTTTSMTPLSDKPMTASNEVSLLLGTPLISNTEISSTQNTEPLAPVPTANLLMFSP